MAPSSQSQISHSDQARINSSFSSYKRGSSKAQLCLQKILHIILTIPSDRNTNMTNQPSSENGIKDVSVSVPVPAPPPEMNDPVQLSPATAFADEGPAVNSEGKVQVVEEENNPDGDDKNGGEDYMGLLIDAAKLIFGEIKEDVKEDADQNQSFDDFNDNDEPTEKPELNNTSKPRSQRWPVGFYEDTEPEPVVRSKRGRTQVLPGKYRDSVLEPLTRVSRNHRSSIISSKRRLR